MPKDSYLEEFAYFHSAAQSTAHHFDQLNWVLNGLASAAILGLSPTAFSNIFFPKADSQYYLLFVGVAFISVAVAWIVIFRRHRFLVNLCYSTLHKLEDKIQEIIKQSDVAGSEAVRLHLEIKHQYPSAGKVKTGQVVGAIQGFALGVGCVQIGLGLLALIH